MLNYKEPLELMGVPGSPYTRKMLALLRYRRIRFHLIPGSRHRVDLDEDRFPARPAPKVPLLPTFYAVDENGEECAICDSTPLIRDFEKAFAGRSVIPEQGVLALLNSILEDYADEWLTKAMFHYRWSYAADIRKAGQMLPRWNNITASETIMAQKAQEISELQISRLRYVGSNSITRETIESSFIRFIDLFDKHLNIQPFLLGKRPSSCDFAVFGQLSCLALFDPTPQQIILERVPRVYAWTELMEDLSGYELLEGDYPESNGAVSELPESLRAIIGEVGRVYAPYLLANAEAVSNKQAEMTTELDSRPWQQQAFPYQLKCLKWLREEYELLQEEQKSALGQVFADSNIMSLFK